MCTQDSLRCEPAVPKGVDDAVGVAEKYWFVAIVNHNSEISTSQKLSTQGYDTYVATQQEVRVWRNGRRAKVDRVVIPSLVFVRCTERERLAIVRLPYIFRFLTNKAATPGQFGRPVAIVPPRQMELLRFMLGHADRPVSITDRPYGRGDKVRVIRGSLRGLEGEVLSASDGSGSELLVRLDILGCAKVSIDPTDLEPVE